MAKFKTVVGYPNYQISDEGTLLNKRGRPIALKPNCFGYHTAQLYPQGDRVQVHRLVLEAFVGPCPTGMECRHLDGDGTNNRLENLAWGTAKENSADRRRHGTQVCGEQLSPLTEADVLAIINDGRLNSEIANDYNVAHQTIADIKARKSWTWFTDGRDIVPSPMQRSRHDPETIRRVGLDGRSSAKVAADIGITVGSVIYIRNRNPDFPRPPVGKGSAKITEDDVRAIRVAEGTCKDVGARFGICGASVHLIRHRVNWSHVEDVPTA
jgi:hypothetical protein